MVDDIAPREFKGPPRNVRKGLILIYTGEGKGKSTAGFGAVFRSLGRGMQVGVVQFIKGEWVSGEVKALEKFGDQAYYESVGEGFTWNTKDLDRDIACAKKGWDVCLKLIRDAKYDVLLFDELVYVLKYKFLDVNDIIAGLKEKTEKTHIILTGRDAPEPLVAIADLVTEMKEIKHPYKRGIPAQPGIDY